MDELAPVVGDTQEPPALHKSLNAVNHIFAAHTELSREIFEKHHLSKDDVIDELFQFVLVLCILLLLVANTLDNEHIFPLVVLLALPLFRLFLLFAFNLLLLQLFLLPFIILLQLLGLLLRSLLLPLLSLLPESILHTLFLLLLLQLGNLLFCQFVI
jgi:hypothetical protein